MKEFMINRRIFLFSFQNDRIKNWNELANGAREFHSHMIHDKYDLWLQKSKYIVKKKYSKIIEYHLLKRFSLLYAIAFRNQSIKILFLSSNSMQKISIFFLYAYARLQKFLFNNSRKHFAEKFTYANLLAFLSSYDVIKKMTR